MAIGVRSTSSVVSTGSIATGATVSLPTPAGLAAGDLFLILAFFAQAQGNVTATTPTGFTSVTPSGGASTQRLFASFTRTVPDAAAVSSIGSSVTVTNPASGTASRVAVLGIALTGVNLSAPLASSSAILWNTASATSVTVQTAATGDARLAFVVSNASATTTHGDHTPTSGTKVAQATSLSAASGSASDSIASAHLDAASVTFTQATANSGTYTLGFAAAPAPATVALTPSQVTLSGVAVSPSSSSVPTVALNPAVVSLAGQPASPAAGPVTVALTPATVTFQAVPVARPATIANWLSTATYFAAHRGGGDNWPEHTMAAYDNAYNKGMRAIEISCHRTSDNVWVCHHDLNTIRMCGTMTTDGPNYVIQQTPWATLQTATNGAYATKPSHSANTGKYALTDTTERQPIPLLTDVLDKYLGKVVLLIEPKNGDDAAALLELLETYGRPTTSVVWKQVATSNAATATARSRGYFLWGYITQVQTPSMTDAQIATHAANYDMLGCNFLDTDQNITRIVNAGNANNPRRRVMAWEMHRPETITENGQRQLGTQGMRALGVEGFMTSNLNAVDTTPEPYSTPSTVALAPASVALVNPAATPTASAVTVTLSPASFMFAGQQVTPTPGAVSVALSPTALTLTGVPVSPSGGSATVALQPSQVTLVGVGASASPQPVSVALSPSTVALTGRASAPTPGPLTVALKPASVSFVISALTPNTGVPVVPLGFLYRKRQDGTWEPLTLVTITEAGGYGTTAYGTASWV